ncbi:hypothetical protein Acin_0602 [Acidaminococcus intestini RyC-MR95]|uniref:Uncharacterized protein n=1 Tax=Acidaminococcus intestini (strain RyC-MR95) TaxID=568816 RepID=G4Q448_ACIIR|nr:hypothetical protein Acin_0602 [Acidaminococcus intestini RyC-MR95]
MILHEKSQPSRGQSIHLIVEMIFLRYSYPIISWEGYKRSHKIDKRS